MTRQCILSAYDISEPRRLARTRAAVSHWAHGGQKSVWECFLLPAERQKMGAGLFAHVDVREDRLAFLLPRFDQAMALGRAVLAEDDPVIFVG